jgi:hypothetical protein
MFDYGTKFAGLGIGTFPTFAAKNASGPKAQDGFPFTADSANDWVGFTQALLNKAGLTPSGQAEVNGASQLVRAMEILFLEKLLYVGKFIAQLPDEPSPSEAGLPGDWMDWSGKAVLYGVSQSAPPSFVDYYTKVGTSIAAGSTPVVCYHKTGDDYRLYRFISQTAAYTVPDELDPVKWTYLEPGEIAARQVCGNALTDGDYDIGDVIPSGVHAGKYITEFICLGGKFPSVEGGNRPTYISGGIGEGTIPDIKGEFQHTLSTPNTSGAFYTISSSGSAGTGTAHGMYRLGLDVSRVAKTGPENSPRTLATRYWRLVSL